MAMSVAARVGGLASLGGSYAVMLWIDGWQTLD